MIALWTPWWVNFGRRLMIVYKISGFCPRLFLSHMYDSRFFDLMHLSDVAVQPLVLRWVQQEWSPCFTSPLGQKQRRGSNQNWMIVGGHVSPAVNDIGAPINVDIYKWRKWWLFITFKNLPA
jgi:hypothetical protein